MIRILNMSEVSREEIFARNDTVNSVENIVTDIIANVKENGDAALREYCERFDKVCLERFEVTPEEIEHALTQVEPRFLDVLKKAAANIRAFHQKQLREGFVINGQDGVMLGQKITPIERVGLYVPGGTAALSSTVLMDSIPAKIAGCRDIIIVTPPKRDGSIDPSILAAAYIAGVTRIFKLGGAQAVAALAYGTESVPKVDKIVGPGNAFVAEAKRQVFGKVAIDMIAGPSDILVLADSTANPRHVAADLLSQAEHDKMATAVLVTDDAALAQRVAEQIEVQLASLPRAEIARISIENNGKIIVTDDLDASIDVANELAPEHLELCVEEPLRLLDKVRNAGSVFLGHNCPEPLGDYLAGPNHTLPTGGTAKFSSPLSVDDFVKKTQFCYYTRDALRQVADDVHLFATKEGLDAHARAATIRFEEDEQ
ncbi:MAG: histidinol dehydrogenase [Clostridia bacterium]|nr:histidinol dehydrogenase [Clostridia bacterium]